MFGTQDLNLSNKLQNATFGAQFFCGAENRQIRKVDINCVEGFEMWCWRRMETIR